MGNLLKYHLTWGNVFTTTVLFTVMRATWDHLTLYQNRYDTKDLLHHMFYMIESMTAFAMCLSLRMDGHDWDKDKYTAPFAVAAAIARIAQSLMYSHVLAQSCKHSEYIRSEAIAQRLSAVLLISSAIWAKEGLDYAYFWIAAVLVERPLMHIFVFFVLPRTINTMYRVPQHTSHLIHRQVRISLLNCPTCQQVCISLTNGHRVTPHRALSFCLFWARLSSSSFKLSTVAPSRITRRLSWASGSFSTLATCTISNR